MLWVCLAETGAKQLAGSACLAVRTVQLGKNACKHVLREVTSTYMQCWIAAHAVAACMSHISCHSNPECACHKHSKRPSMTVHNSTFLKQQLAAKTSAQQLARSW